MILVHLRGLRCPATHRYGRCRGFPPAAICPKEPQAGHDLETFVPATRRRHRSGGCAGHGGPGHAPAGRLGAGGAASRRHGDARPLLVQRRQRLHARPGLPGTAERRRCALVDRPRLADVRPRVPPGGAFLRTHRIRELARQAHVEHQPLGIARIVERRDLQRPLLRPPTRWGPRACASTPRARGHRWPRSGRPPTRQGAARTSGARWRASRSWSTCSPRPWGRTRSSRSGWS